MSISRGHTDLESLNTAREAARRLSVCEQTLKRWARSGKIRYLKTPGGRWRYAVDEFIAQRVK